MSDNLYDAVMDRLQYDEAAEIEKIKGRIVFPELDTELLGLGIAAALCSTKDRVVVASNN